VRRSLKLKQRGDVTLQLLQNCLCHSWVPQRWRKSNTRFQIRSATEASVAETRGRALDHERQMSEDLSWGRRVVEIS